MGGGTEEAGGSSLSLSPPPLSSEPPRPRLSPRQRRLGVEAGTEPPGAASGAGSTSRPGLSPQSLLIWVKHEVKRKLSPHPHVTASTASAPEPAG